MSLTVVMGPPTGGKSSWVMSQARAQDIVIDFDRLAVALAGPGADSHDHAPEAKEITMRAWRAAINEALAHVDQAEVYLIHSMPSAHALTRYKRHGARMVTIDPGREVVEERCRQLRPSMLSVVGRWYARQSRPQPVMQNSRAW